MLLSVCRRPSPVRRFLIARRQWPCVCRRWIQTHSESSAPSIPRSPPPPPPFFAAASGVAADSVAYGDTAIESMTVERLLSTLYVDGAWSGKDTINALTAFAAAQCPTVASLRALSDGSWHSMRLSAPLERAVRLYLLSTAHAEHYATRMQIRTDAAAADSDLCRKPLYASGDLGKPMPNSPHACSVALPTWRHVIGYEEGTAEVISAMACGYPRFFIHPYVSRLFDVCERQFADVNETCFAFPSDESAQRCKTFLQSKLGFGVSARTIPLGQTGVVAVVFRKNIRLPVRLYWQHFGDIISSRFAWDILHNTIKPAVPELKRTIRGRIATAMRVDADDVYLYVSGMAAISKSLQMVQVLSPGVRSVQFGFPYLDAYKIQTVFGPGALFYPRGDDADIDALSSKLEHEHFSAVMVEFPGNPLLALPNLPKLSAILRRHRIPLIVDDTVSSFGCVNVLPYADIVTSSLTKWFSGVGDVMAGSLTLNAASPFYADLKQWQTVRFEDNLYAEDAAVLERNSVRFEDRLKRINRTAAAVVDFLRKHPQIQQINSPLIHDTMWGDTKFKSDEPHNAFHPAMTAPQSAGGGFGGLFSFVLRNASVTTPPFFDALRVSKGPSLGNNFTLACPYTMLAHYTELDWAESVGIDRHLLRVSIGCEDANDLCNRFADALNAVADL